MSRPSKAEIVIFNGIRFRRYPESKRREDRVYFVPNMADRKRGIGRLHQEIWKSAHGPIPEGYEVHHKDHNPLNNDLDNLELLSKSEHWAHHAATLTEDELAALRKRMARARRVADNWHRSEEGREWHKELARIAAEQRYSVVKTCDHCGSTFETDNVSASRARFCSNACKTAARLASGIDNEIRTCAHCGTRFTANKYTPIRFCSLTCSSRARYSRNPNK